MHIFKTNLNIFLFFAFLFYFCFYFYQFVICFFEMDFKYSPATSSWLPELQAWATMSRFYIHIYIQDLCLRASSSTQHRGWIGHAAEGSEGRQSKLYPQQAIEENSRGSRLFQGSWGLPAESQLLGSSCREPASVKEAGVTHFRHFSSIVRWVHQTAKPSPTPLPNLHSLH